MERVGFNVVFNHDEILKYVRTLPKNIQLTLGRALKDRLSVDPIGYGIPLRHNLKGLRKLRVGKYRVLYHVDEEQKIVNIYKIGIRKNVYEG